LWLPKTDGGCSAGGELSKHTHTHRRAGNAGYVPGYESFGRLVRLVQVTFQSVGRHFSALQPALLPLRPEPRGATEAIEG